MRIESGRTGCGSVTVCAAKATLLIREMITNRSIFLRCFGLRAFGFCVFGLQSWISGFDLLAFELPLGFDFWFGSCFELLYLVFGSRNLRFEISDLTIS